MAYGLKYILRYETERFGTDIRVLIYAKDYTGEATPKKIGAGHIQLSIDRDGQIKGSTLDFSIQADTDMEYASFFTLDNKAHRVELEFNHGVTWTGYIVADQYSEPFIAPPYDVQVMCTDGLGLLKNETFALTGMVSRFEAIRYCIDKIGIALPYAININIWEEHMNMAAHNMLDQLYFQAEILSDKNCYEAIQTLLPENCFINQANGYWMVERPTDRTLPRYVFNADGTPSEETYNWHTFLRQLNTVAYSKTHTGGTLYPIGNLTQDMQSAWRKFTIKQQFGKKESFFKNYNFQQNTAWWSATPTFFPFFSVKKSDKTSYAIISGYQNSLINKIQQSIDVISTSAVTLEINYAIVGVVPVSIYQQSHGMQTEIQIKVKLDGKNGTIYYLDQNGWGTTDKNIIIKGIISDLSFDTINFQPLNFTVSKLPQSGIVTIQIFQVVPTPEALALDQMVHCYRGLCIESIKFVANDITLFNDSEETEVILNENATESNKTIDLLPVDLPDFENNQLFFENGNYVKIGEIYKPTNKWGSQKVRYIEYLAAYMAYLYQSSRTVLKGVISGWLELNSYIIHELSNKIYLIDKGTWNVIEHTFNLELIELPDGDFIYDDYAPISLKLATDPLWNMLPEQITTDASNVYYRGSDGELVNKLGENAVVASMHIIFPHHPIDIFNREDTDYWNGLTTIDADPRKWPVEELNNATIATKGTAVTQARLFLNDYVSDPSDVLPLVSYPTDRTNVEEIQNLILQSQCLAGNHIKTIDGSFEVPIPKTSTSVIVARKQTIDPYKLDFDSGTPQFSIKDAELETNVANVPNDIKIYAGKIISHNYGALDRTSIRFIKESNEEYDPTRSWNIAETDITLPDDDGVFIYVKVPLS